MSRAGLGSVLENLKTRDRIDSSRRMSPLRRVPDAVLVDTTMLSIEEQVRIVCALVRRRQAARGAEPNTKTTENTKGQTRRRGQAR